MHTAIIDWIGHDGRQDSVVKVSSEAESYNTQWHVLGLQLRLPVNILLFGNYACIQQQYHYSCTSLSLSSQWVIFPGYGQCFQFPSVL